MSSSPSQRSRFHASPATGIRWLNGITLLCLAFGVSLILNVQVAGDGMWFWYAKLLLSGKHIYGDLHLPLQPLYVVITALVMHLFGDGWLVSKLPALLMLLFSVLTLRAIAAQMPLRDGPRSMLLLGAFAFPLLFEAERFDDYHILADCFQIGGIFVLLQLRRSKTSQKVFTCAVLLGVCGGLSMMSRLNDGALLWTSLLLCILGMAPLRHWAAAMVFAGTSALTVVLTILSTHDTFHAWFINSILRAAGPKGGSGRLIFYPFQLFWNAFTQFFHYPVLFLLLAGGVLLWFAAAWLSRLPQLQRPGAPVGLPVAVFTLAAFSYIVVIKVHLWGITGPPSALCATMVLVGLIVGIFTLLRADAALRDRTTARPGWLSGFNPVQLLVLVPLSQLVSGSLSSAGDFVPLSAPIGMLLLVLPLAFPDFFTVAGRGYAYASIVGITSLCCLGYKAIVPFSWHSYHNEPLFTLRQWYRHPDYGPMYIETDLLEAMLPMCARAHDVPDPSMLSSPFPYANYFCNITPWRGEVQTFFDISTESMIRDLDAHLLTDPPHTIVYQRQMMNMITHERIYQHFKHLPQRELDTLLIEKVKSGQWSLASQLCIADSDWLVIETVPRSSEPKGRVVPLNAFPYRCNDISPTDTAKIYRIEHQQALEGGKSKE